MENLKLEYADVIMKQRVENWADKFGFCADLQIAMHLEERFGVSWARIVCAREAEDCLLLQISTERWDGSREFALLRSGSLAW